RAVDAAELVDVDYEPLPAMVDLQRAAADEVVLFPDTGTNTLNHTGGQPDPSLFGDCAVVVTQRIVNNRVAPAPLEGRAAAAVWAPDHTGTPRLTIWLP